MKPGNSELAYSVLVIARKSIVVWLELALKLHRYSLETLFILHWYTSTETVYNQKYFDELDNTKCFV